MRYDATKIKANTCVTFYGCVDYSTHGSYELVNNVVY